MEHCAEPKLRCAGINRSYQATWTPYLVMKAIARVTFILINNIYGIPTYMLWLLLLRPLSWYKKTASLYWYIEGLMFRWLLNQVGSWIWSAGYKVCAVGEDIRPVLKERCLVLCNHQSTGDVPLLMYNLQGFSASQKVMWIMDVLFKFTNFGIVSQVHGDFFILQGKETRHLQLDQLRDHLLGTYMDHQMEWVVLFPEGGFLRKRRENNNRFALKNGYPTLQHVTLPRVGAMKVCMDTLARQQNGYHATEAAKSAGAVGNGKPDSGALKWIVDVTIGYPQGQPLDVFAILFGHRSPCTTQMLYRLYPVHELPTDEEELKQWMYQRYIEKELLLDHFYATGEFPPLDPTKCHGELRQGKEDSYFNLLIVILLNVWEIGTVYYAWKVLMLVLTPLWFVLGWL